MSVSYAAMAFLQDFENKELGGGCLTLPTSPAKSTIDSETPRSRFTGGRKPLSKKAKEFLKDGMLDKLSDQERKNLRPKDLANITVSSNSLVTQLYWSSCRLRQ